MKPPVAPTLPPLADHDYVDQVIARHSARAGRLLSIQHIENAVGEGGQP